MSDLLSMALDAAVPFISIDTTDLVLAHETLNHWTDKPVVILGTGALTDPKADTVYSTFAGISAIKLETTYNKLLAAGSSLVFLNTHEPGILHAGRLYPPKHYIETTIERFTTGEDFPHVVNALQGVTMKGIVEILMLAQATYNKVDATTIRKCRLALGVPTQGLESLEPQSLHYIAPKWLMDWFQRENFFLWNSKYPDLAPKGMLLHGPPGTGKSEAACWIGNRFNRPVFRLDAGTLYNKYVGDSERNLKNALAHIDRQGSCVFLLDEVDKLFRSNETNAETNVLSILLWWLQMRKADVFTVMTANHIDIVPQELYRPGRIDVVQEMLGVPNPLINQFATSYFTHMRDIYGLTNEPDIQSKWLSAREDIPKYPHVPQAQIVAYVTEFIKSQLKTKEG